MNSLEFFFSCFTPLDRSRETTIGDVSTSDFTYDITIINASISESGRKGLIQYFGGVPLEISQIEGTQNLRIKLSRIHMPDTTYSVFSILKFVEKNRQQGWFLGIGDNGPQYLDLKKLTHAQIYGSSGYGKSSFFRFLLAQTLAFHDDVINFIIDPKQIDYKTFKEHPRVSQIATNRDEWFSVLSVLVMEMSVREHLFSQAFSTPPASLDEYNVLKKTHSKSSIPELPRILCWIDEAHILAETMYDELQGMITLLVKKGRALGIHLIFTTQRPADIPNSIKSQATTVFFFYTQEAPVLGGLNWDLPPRGTAAIPGRLNFYDATESKYFLSQVPFIDQNESVGMAFGLGTERLWSNKGIFPLNVSDYLLNDNRLVQLLLKGNTLRSLQGLAQKELETKLRVRTGLFNFVFKDFYPKPASQPPPISKEQNDDTDDELMDELMNSFSKAIQEQAGSQAKAMTSSKSPSSPLLSQSETDALLSAIAPDTTPSAGPASCEISLPTIVKINNTPSRDNMLINFKKAYQESADDLFWCKRDLSANEGLLNILKRKSSGDIDNSAIIKFAEFAIDSNSRNRLNKLINEMKNNFSLERKSPLIIISGYNGFGKRTLVNSIALELNIPADVVSATDRDYSLGIETPLNLFISDASAASDFQSDKKKEIASTPRIIITFDLEDALRLFRNSLFSTPVVFINTWKEDGHNKLNKLDADFKVLNEPHLHLQLSRETYRTPAVLNQLIKTLLEKNFYIDKVNPDEISKHFAMIGIPLFPQNINAIIERGAKRSKMAQQPFDWKILSELLSDLKHQEGNNNGAYQIIQPTKGMSDLVGSEETISGLKDVVTRIANLGNSKFQFSQKLRKGHRLVALFSGPPGTGKSMAAEALANECGKELWVCDISQLQSAFVGETEKILSEVFYAAQTTQSVLLLEEAEVFLQNRSNIQQNYAHKWVNHLLNLIENYTGILILTTNHAQMIDPAFARRIDTKTTFKEPNKDQSIKILKLLLEPDAPLASDLDFNIALEGIDMTGGLLRNAVERLITKMIRYGLNEIDTTFLRSVLLETQREDTVIKTEQKRVGI